MALGSSGGRRRYYGGFRPEWAFMKQAPPTGPNLSNPPLAPEPTEPLITSGTLVFNSTNERCGVREYGDELSAELDKLGLGTSRHRIDDLGTLARAAAGATVLLHAEPSILPPGFDAAVNRAKLQGARVVVCYHYLDTEQLSRFASSAAVLVQHRDYGLGHPRLVTVPLACPVYDNWESLPALRARLGLPAGRRLLTTVGFLAPWKRVPETAEALLPHLAPRDLHLQLVTPVHYSGAGRDELRRLTEVAAGHRDRVTVVDSYVPKRELLDRVAVSDLGFVYHGADTGSVSAATKCFVATRCPLVVTSSSHASDVALGVERVPSRDLGTFVDRLLRLVDDADRLKGLRAEAEIEYARVNMSVVARRYAELLQG